MVPLVNQQARALGIFTLYFDVDFIGKKNSQMAQSAMGTRFNLVEQIALHPAARQDSTEIINDAFF